MNKTVVIVSPYFPPNPLAGVHRARHLAANLPAAGWTPIVLCVDERFHVEQLDHSLAGRVPKGVEIVKTTAVAAGVARRVGLGDVSLRGWLPLRRALTQLLQTRVIDAILITGSPFYPMVYLTGLARRFGVPVVLDFQDPWVSAWGAEQPLFSKAGLSHGLAAALEPGAVRRAAFVTSVSLIQNQEMAARYPWLDPRLMDAIPIGGDPHDFDVASLPETVGPSSRVLAPSKVNISYVGAFWPRAEAPVRQLMRAIALFGSQHPRLADGAQFNFIGTVTGGSVENRLVDAIAAQEGATPWVKESPARLPLFEALAVMKRSQGLMLVGSDEPHYTASKIYPALMSGTPYVSLFHAASSAHAILASAGGGRAFGFTDAQELTDVVPRLAEGLRVLVQDPTAMGSADPHAYALYTAQAVAARYAAVFDRVAGFDAGL